MQRRRDSGNWVLGWCLLVAMATVGHAQPAPRHVILMIADGCGFNHVGAAGLYRTGEARGEVYQRFPVRLAVSTFPVGGSYDPARFWDGLEYAKQGPTDSAAAATALACGVKTKNGYLGVDADGKRVETVLEAAEALGRATGLVSSVPFSHATPAAFAAHEPGRGDYAAIARQMIEESGVDVILSPGNPLFDNDGTRLAKPNFGFLAEALWQSLQAGRAGGDANGDGRPDPWRLLQTRGEIVSLIRGGAGRVFGLAQAGSTLQEGRSSPADNPAKAALPFSVPFTPNVPSLVEMTRAALRTLAADPDGLFLMVEGGAVDWAAHDGLSGRVIEEQMAFGDAVGAVVEWVGTHGGWDDTLLIVTADHETGCLTGPGPDNAWNPVLGRGKGQAPGLKWNYTSHTNSLVPLYARGAGAALLRRYADQRDPVRGRYLDNTEVSQVIREALR